MPRYITAGPRHGRSHVGQCDKNTEEEEELGITDSLLGVERPLVHWL